MEIAKSILANKNDLAKRLALFSVLVGIAVLVPAFIHIQAITGPIVNATLFLAAVLLAPEIAILVGLLPSLIALSSGLLPAPLTPMIPFIMVGNTILILVFHHSRKRNFWLGIGLSSLLKFLFR